MLEEKNAVRGLLAVRPAHLAWKLKVAGSNPAGVATTKFLLFAHSRLLPILSNRGSRLDIFRSPSTLLIASLASFC